MQNKLRPIIYTSLLTFVLFWTACTREDKLHKIKKTDFAMGTIVRITVLDSSEENARHALDLAFQEINRIGSLFYKGNPQSPIYKFNHRQRDKIQMPPEVLKLIARSQKISRATKGSFDMTIEPLLHLYKFSGDSLKPPEKPVIDSIKEQVGYQNITVDLENRTISARDKHIRLATGGNAKGYAVDRVIAILDSLNVDGALVNAGGDLRVLPRSDGKKWTIGIQHPRKINQTIAVIAIDSGAVTTSGDYEQYYIHEGKRYHHILNPKTGYPARASRSTTVIALTAELADALATGLFILGYQKGMKVLEQFTDCQAFWIDSTGQQHSSIGLVKFLQE